MASITEDDEGKRVVHGDDAVGRVIDVKDGDAYVNPDLNITDTLKAKLGWTDADEDTFQLKGVQIERVTDDAIHLRENL